MSLPGKQRFPEDYNHGIHPCGSCGHPHAEPYERWCRAERMRLFPDHFREWTEQEHAAMKHPLTWRQQQAIWFHRATWEAMYDGELTQRQAEQVLAASDPLPSPSVVLAMIHTLAGGMTQRTPRIVHDIEAEERRTEGRSAWELEQFAMAMVNPVPELEPGMEVPA